MIKYPLSIGAGALAGAALLVAGCGGGSGNGNGQATAASPVSQASGGAYGPSSGATGTMAAGTMASHAVHGAEVVHVMAAAGAQLRFTMSTVRVAHPGRVTLRMSNPAGSGLSHGISIEGHGVDKDGPIVAPGRTSSVTATLKKGTYTYYCPVPGHRQAGMHGTLTVA